MRRLLLIAVLLALAAPARGQGPKNPTWTMGTRGKDPEMMTVACDADGQEIFSATETDPTDPQYVQDVMSFSIFPGGAFELCPGKLPAACAADGNGIDVASTDKPTIDAAPRGTWSCHDPANGTITITLLVERVGDLSTP